jgi:NAD(P)-dependent dehydrogenase (short-subunit alcohol dehydrogenase family)
VSNRGNINWHLQEVCARNSMSSKLLNAVVIGSSRGIGLHLCKTLAASSKYAVIGVQRGSETKEQAQLSGVFSRLVTGVDVTKPAQVAHLQAELKEVPVSLLVVVSGILNVDDFAENLDLEGVSRHFEVNAVGPMRVVHALEGNLGHGARVSLITSRMGSIGDPPGGKCYGYRMSKAALNMFGKNLSVEWRDRGVLVSLIHPGMVATDMTAQFGVKSGQGQAVSPAHSADQIFKVCEAMTAENSGVFTHAITEKELPW